MYKMVQSEVESEFIERHGNPVAVLRDEYGGEVRVVIDDSCLLALIKRDDQWKPISHIFKELAECIAFAVKAGMI